jgi:hypothetical protein
MDAWVIKLTPDGKMIWNKYVGEEFNDEINLLKVNSRNEILGAGYTWTGRDTSSREAWLFKLGADGQKLWSKKLGKMHIRTMTVTREGAIFLGGYLINDSLQSLYSVVVLNENGKRLWARTYTGRGEIIQIAECPDRKILLAGNHWRAKIDARGYLLWEEPFNDTDSIVAARVNSKGEILFLGMRNDSQLVLIKTGSDNKPLLEKALAVPEIRLRVNTVINGGINQVIALITFDDHQSINLINTINGEITGSLRLPSGIYYNTIISDINNNLLIEACNGEIILIKNNGLSF